MSNYELVSPYSFILHTNIIGYYYFMQTLMPLCMTLNCALATVVSSMFEVGQA